MEDIEIEKFLEELRTVETNVTQLKNEMKKLPLAEKMDKETEKKKLQQQVTMLHTQQQQRADKVEELQEEDERVTGII